MSEKKLEIKKEKPVRFTISIDADLYRLLEKGLKTRFRFWNRQLVVQTALAEYLEPSLKVVKGMPKFEGVVPVSNNFRK